MISQRASSLKASETMKITALAKEMARAGKSVISLSAGEPDFKTPKHICDAAIKAIENGKHGYTMNNGTPELREAIVAKLKRDNNLDYSPNDIIVSNGAKQSIGFAILATINEGDEVIIPAPYWVSYPPMVELALGTPITIRTAFETNFKLSPEALEAAITPKTRGFVLCSPSNPTGSCYTREELKALGDVLLKYPDIIVYSDEIYEYIVFEGKHISILEVVPELKDRTVLVNGHSKGFAMTGWRIGYMAGPESIAKAVGKLQGQETSAPSHISQIAAEAAYKGSLGEVDKMRVAFKERRDYLVNALNSIEGVSCPTPDGAFYVFPNISTYLGKKDQNGTVYPNSTELCMYILEQHGVACVPGDAFGEPDGLRLSYATSMSNLEEAVKRISAALANLS